MAYTSLARSVWSARLNYNLMNSLVYGKLTNSDYEGDAANASVVKINNISAITVAPYVHGTGLSDPSNVDTTSIDLTLDQNQSFNFMVGDITKATTNINTVDGAMENAAYAIANAIDSYVAGLYTGVDSGNFLGTDIAPETIGIGAEEYKAYDFIVDLGTILNKANVPFAGRFVIVPPDVLGLLAKDARFTSSPEVRANGIVEGQLISGMQVHMSNNCPNTDGDLNKIIAGSSKAIAFATALKEMESYRPDKFFADAVRGLQVYGAKLLNPKALAVGVANIGTTR